MAYSPRPLFIRLAHSLTPHMSYEKSAKNWILKEKYGGQILTLPEDDSRRLQAGEPADYIIGWSSFLECKIDLSFKPFIPRTETEYWVSETLKDIPRTRKKTLRCLDIFAGSGCIGIALLKHLPNVLVDFADIETECTRQIELNANINGIKTNRFRVIKSDIFANLKDSYDCIFANPPYCATEIVGRVEGSVKKFEPTEALWGGGDGLLYIKALLESAKNFLKPRGAIYMEFDDIQKVSINAILRERGYKCWQFFKDQFGLWRYLKVIE